MAAPRWDKASTGTRKTTRAFLTPMSGVINHGQPWPIERLDLAERRQPEAKGPMNDGGEVRYPREQHLVEFVEQVQDAWHRPKGDHGLQNEQNANDAGVGGFVYSDDFGARGGGFLLERKVFLKAVDARPEKFDLLVLARFRFAVLSELLSTAERPWLSSSRGCGACARAGS
jgi:hypothetical protein